MSLSRLLLHLQRRATAARETVGPRPPAWISCGFCDKGQFGSSCGFACFISGAEHMIKTRHIHSPGELIPPCVTWPINPATHAVQGLGDEAKNRLYNPSRSLKNLCSNCGQLICGCNSESSPPQMQFDAASVHYAQVETLNGDAELRGM